MTARGDESCEGARPIETAEDVRGVLESDRRSFYELLDCLRVAKGADDWQLVDAVAVLVLQRIAGRRVPPVRVKDVFDLIVQARLKKVRSLEDLPVGAKQTMAALDELVDGLAEELRRTAAVTRSELEELIALLADATAPSYGSTCARLRKFGRPDLGVVAAGRSLHMQPQNAKAHNTRAAAYMDLGQLNEAYSDLVVALRLEKSEFTANAMSRYSGMRGSWDEAVQWAKVANELDPNGAAGMLSLAKAAKVQGDSATLRAALLGLGGKQDDQLFLLERRSPWVEVTVARSLLRDGRVVEAEQMVAAILRERDYRPARDLELEIRARRTKSNGL